MHVLYYLVDPKVFIFWMELALLIIWEDKTETLFIGDIWQEVFPRSRDGITDYTLIQGINGLNDSTTWRMLAMQEVDPDPKPAGFGLKTKCNIWSNQLWNLDFQALRM